MRRISTLGLLTLTHCADAPEATPPRCTDAPASCPASAGPFGDPIVHLGRAQGDTFIEILDVAVHWPYVYACTGTQGLTIWDARDRSVVREGVAPPVAHPQFPRCQHVAVDPSGSRLVVTNRGDEVQPDPFLWTFDLEDESSPRAAAGWEPTASIEGIAFGDDRIYVATHDRGVSVLSLASAELLGSFDDAASAAWQPAVVAGGLVVAEGATGLRTYDVATETPMLRATLPVAGAATDVVVRGELAYVAAGAELSIVDIRSLDAPSIIASIPTPGTVVAVASPSPGVVVTAEWDRLRMYDVADPTGVRSLGSERLPSGGDFSRVLALDANADGSRLFAGEWEGLHELALDHQLRAPDVSLAPSVLQFGDETSTRVLVVRNRGSAPLTVDGIATHRGVVTDASCFRLDPDDARAIEVRVEDGLEASTQQVTLCSDDVDEAELPVLLAGGGSGLGVGDPAPAFDLRDLEAERWTLDGLRGNVVVLAYFATF